MCFFSSRRRHTRFKCDWSSDVCSSDLTCQIFHPCSHNFAFLQNTLFVPATWQARTRLPGDHKGRPLGINLTKSPSNSVGARVGRGGGEGPDGPPRPVPRADKGGGSRPPPRTRRPSRPSPPPTNRPPPLR